MRSCLGEYYRIMSLGAMDVGGIWSITGTTVYSGKIVRMTDLLVTALLSESVGSTALLVNADRASDTR